MHKDITTPPQPTTARTRLVLPLTPTRSPDIVREPYGYVRVSTVMQRLKGYSLPQQLKAIAAAAAADGQPITEENLLGDADSGRKFDRKGLQTLLARAREGRVSVVYFAKVDRIGRNSRDSQNIVHELDQCGVRIVVLDPRLDTKDRFGYFLFVILAAMAELEATFILERTMGGKLEKLAQWEGEGRAPKPGGRKAPYGLRYIPPTKKGEDGTWERVQEEVRGILWIFGQIARYRGGDDVAAELNRRGVPGPAGGRWNDVAVRRIVRSTTYIGKMPRRMAGQEFTFDVPPIVPQELFDLANQALDQNKKRSRRNAQHEYLLASSKAAPRLKCRLCHQAGEEHIMGGRTRHGPRGASRRGEYYSCWHWEGDKRARHTVPAVKLEDAVWDALCAMLRDPERVLARFERIAQAASMEAHELTTQLAALDEAANENRLAQQRLVEMGVRGRIAADLLAQQEEELAAEAHEIAQRKALLGAQLDVARQGQVPIKQVQDACALLAEGALEAGFAEKRWLIGLLVDEIYADKCGWRLQGRLPGMDAEGTFTGASFFEAQGS